MGVTSVLRRFNRTYTQRIGVLDESYLGTGRPLNASRLLFEIGAAETVTIRQLRDRLNLDSGYVTRILTRLENDGLVRVVPDPTDGRRRIVELTPAGRAAVAELEQRSENLAATLVAPLTARQQQRLADALAIADLLVRAATVTLEAVEPDSIHARTALSHYFDELNDRFPQGFEPGAPSGVETGARYAAALSDGQPVAFGGFRSIEVGEPRPVAEIKRMWVDKRWRGAGLGARILRHLETLAREEGFTRVLLDTNGTLVEAIALYERAGYVRIDRYNDNPYAQHFFEKRL
ncbi:bifunctional helix-turn-helix transcriptional regulator/GNAT family N-acetyltransferase [Mycolicibacterium sp. S2-37]|uniref:bifunctional helix-turn-helix transcriptional regulator/GNAT family N-acetyltransferase n=1 Tax=Mycolicibacterium sp. S2-37 TaxID=2810297 RepID=UPI001A9535EA|nr:bifunctional helix-turn-helix transcriptional regulator/GNAT family N-acetyltransferase [Mycolicibacterium sp. S2-37]MBO0678757.1 bifunctional helix-turn-helix transcriptional regulator/GNAT family N-acetyltransferase [Mycolicibacterium sp. S2-37]